MQTSIEMRMELLSHVKEGSYVLEPSAGRGYIAVELHKKGCKVDCIELNKENYWYLDTMNRNRWFNEVYNKDFLKLEPAFIPKYDYVVAVPPYKDNVDCEHIMHMYDCVKVGGKVISFTLPTWVTGMYSNQIAFRKWLADKKYTIKFFEDESYVSCPKMLLIIEK